MNALGAVRQPTARLLRRSAWRWALAAVGMTAIVLGGTLAGHVLITRQHQPPAVSAPALPTLPVAAVTASTTDFELVSLDAPLGHLVALVSSRQPSCPPVGACPPPPALERFIVLNGATARPLVATPLTGAAAPAAKSVLLLADGVSHQAYAVAPHTVTIFSTVTGAYVGGYALPGAVHWVQPTCGVLDPAAAALILVGAGQLAVLKARTGHLLALQAVAASSTLLDGPALDSARSLIFLLQHQRGGAAQVLGFDALTLTPRGRALLPTDAHLGPIDPTTGVLYAFSAVSTTYRITVAGEGAALLVRSDGPAGALALGWHAALGHTYVARVNALEVDATATGKPLAVLPLRAHWNAAAPLPADPRQGLLYLPAAHGAILIARDAPRFDAPLTPAAAALLARAALPHFLPDTNQDPPFLDADTFWIDAGPDAVATLPVNYWIHFADRGWTGPYPGTARLTVTPQSGRSATEAYRVTFTSTWYQLFTRTHSWICTVAPSGAVSLTSEGGDAVP
jgi:hypothetical protein